MTATLVGPKHGASHHVLLVELRPSTFWHQVKKSNTIVATRYSGINELTLVVTGINERMNE